MKKILVAEDDLFLSRIYKKKLTDIGYEILLFESGVDVSKTAGEEKPNLIILDLIMPNKDGFTVLEELSRNPDSSKIPKLIISNLGQDEDIQRAKKLGATFYMIKSDFSFNEVASQIKKLIK